LLCIARPLRAASSPRKGRPLAQATNPRTGALVGDRNDEMLDMVP